MTENQKAAAQPRVAASLSDEVKQWQEQYASQAKITASSYQPTVVSNATNVVNYSAASLTGLK